jgi:hypothetical protein
MAISSQSRRLCRARPPRSKTFPTQLLTARAEYLERELSQRFAGREVRMCALADRVGAHVGTSIASAPGSFFTVLMPAELRFSPCPAMPSGHVRKSDIHRFFRRLLARGNRRPIRIVSPKIQGQNLRKIGRPPRSAARTTMRIAASATMTTQVDRNAVTAHPLGSVHHPVPLLAVTGEPALWLMAREADRYSRWPSGLPEWQSCPLNRRPWK